MKRMTALLLAWMLLTLPAKGEEGNLNLRVDAIRERRPTYTSVTDLYGLDILTPASDERERLYAQWLEEQRRQELGGLFLAGPVQTLGEEERIRTRAQELGLFEQASSQTYFRQDDAQAGGAVNPILTAALIILLCIGGFLFSNSRYKRKKRRQGLDVHHRNASHL